LSEGYPKTLLKLLGKPIVAYSIENLYSLGIRDITVVTTGDVEKFRRELSGYDVAFVRQRYGELEGAIKSAKKHFASENTFVLVFGDTVAPPEAFKVVMDSYLNSSAEAAALILPQRHVETYGVPTLIEGGYIKSVSEKPSRGVRTKYVMGGFYVLPTTIFDILEEGSTFIEAVNRIAEEGLIYGMWTGYWYDIGYPWDLIRAARALLSGVRESRVHRDSEISSNAVIKGPVIIDRGVQVEDKAVLKGPVYIGEGTYVGTHTLIRNYTSIEGGCVIGAYSEVNSSVIQPFSVISRNSFVAYSVIGSRTVIGPGTIVMLLYGGKISEALGLAPSRTPEKIGAAIGHNVRIGPYNLIMPGAKISSKTETDAYMKIL